MSSASMRTQRLRVGAPCCGTRDTHELVGAAALHSRREGELTYE